MAGMPTTMVIDRIAMTRRSSVMTAAVVTALAVTVAMVVSAGARAADATAADAPVPTAMLTFEQAFERATASGPAALAAQGERDVATARLRQARSWENPTLSVEVENVLGRGVYRDFDSAESTVSLSQPLPLGGGRGARLRAAEADESAAATRLALAAIELRRDLAIAYAEAIAADRLAVIGRARAALGAETRAAVERRHAAGLESDLQRARVEVETAGMQADARRSAAAALAHRRALAAHWREETVTAPLDEGWFDRAPGSAIGSATGSVTGPASDAEALRSHPRLVIARARVAQAQALLDAARGERYGGVEATVGTRRFEGSTEGDRAWVLGLSMPLPVWDRNAAGIAEARWALQAAELDAERVARELSAEREAALAESEAARLEVDALVTSGLPAATSAAKLSAQGYEAGRLSLLERLDAERAAVQVQEQLVAARLRQRTAEARLAALQASSTDR